VGPKSSNIGEESPDKGPLGCGKGCDRARIVFLPLGLGQRGCSWLGAKPQKNTPCGARKPQSHRVTSGVRGLLEASFQPSGGALEPWSPTHVGSLRICEPWSGPLVLPAAGGEGSIWALHSRDAPAAREGVFSPPLPPPYPAREPRNHGLQAPVPPARALATQRCPKGPGEGWTGTLPLSSQALPHLPVPPRANSPGALARRGRSSIRGARGSPAPAPSRSLPPRSPQRPQQPRCSPARRKQVRAPRQRLPRAGKGAGAGEGEAGAVGPAPSRAAPQPRPWPAGASCREEGGRPGGLILGRPASFAPWGGRGRPRTGTRAEIEQRGVAGGRGPEAGSGGEGQTA
jgi:hypothetical protein